MKKNKEKSEKVADKPKIIGSSTKVSSSKLEGLVKKKKAEQEEPAEGKKKKSKEGKVKKDKGTSQRATNYNFPKDCVDAKDRKKFRTTVRKKNEQFENKLAEVKVGGKNEKAERAAINKDWAAFKATVYLSTKDAAE